MCVVQFYRRLAVMKGCLCTSTLKLLMIAHMPRKWIIKRQLEKSQPFSLAKEKLK
jgi:hypothetical protein